MNELYTDLPELKYFKKVDLEEVESMAVGLAEDEVLAYYALDTEELMQESENGELVPSADLIWFRKACKRGRSKGQIRAVERLFSNMNDRNGGNYALAYLRQMASSWPASEAKEASDGFSFKVVMDGK